MSKEVYRGELTEEQISLYGYKFKTCQFCASDYLVLSQLVNDAYCESCGKWQDGEEIEATPCQCLDCSDTPLDERPQQI